MIPMTWPTWRQTPVLPPRAASLKRPLQKHPLKEARAHFERGVEYYTEGDFRAALVELTRAYALQPTYKMLYNLGQVAFELRDYAHDITNNLLTGFAPPALETMINTVVSADAVIAVDRQP